MRLDTCPRAARRSAGATRATAALVVLLALPVYPQRAEHAQGVNVPRLGITLKAGWQLRFFEGCRFAVPPTWRVTADGSQAFAPDGSSIWVWTVHVPNWSVHKSQVKASFGAVHSVREDTDRRLWIAASGPMTRHYVAVSDGLSACEGLLEMPSPSGHAADIATTIADSVGVAPAPRLSEFR